MARIRSSAHGKTAAVAAADDDLDFPHFRRQLRAAGWTYKKPSGLATEGQYVSPDGSGVFVGERALVEHALLSGMLNDDEAGDEDKTASPTAPRTPAVSTTPKNSIRASSPAPRTPTSKNPTRASAAAGSAAVVAPSASPATPSTPTAAKPQKSTRASAAAASTSPAPPSTPTPAASPSGNDLEGFSLIDTTVALSQSTLNALFDSPSAPVVLSQAAVPRAFGLSPSGIPDASQQQAAAGLQLLSEASGLDSAGSGHDDDEEQKASEPSGRVLRRRTRVRFKPDVNFVASDEDTSDYESFASGNEADDAVDEDEEPEQVLGDDEDDVLSDDDAAQLDEAFIESLMIGLVALRGAAQKKQEKVLRETKWTSTSSFFESGGTSYPGLGDVDAVPSAELRAVAHSPLLTFFYFMPKSLWVSITEETNRYVLQQLNRRAEALHAKQRAAGKTETLKQIRRRLKNKRGYDTHEILHVVGLLVARMLCPQKRRFADHWSLVEDGAVPSGNFGRFMGRNRCQDILRDLQFMDNEADRTRDKLWKLRPVVEKLQQRFLAGWSLPPVFSFNEVVLPSTSKRNTTRMLMPDTPRRYGSKMFMTCDPRTAYCPRFEMYTGKRPAGEHESSFDHKTGAAAVVRNLKIVLEAKRQPWHAVVIERYYSSVLLAVELLTMKVYVFGTIMTDRLGYDVQVKEGRKTRPASIPRGKFTYSRSPMHYLCTGALMTESSVGRKIKGVGAITVPCPAAVLDYQRLMGGVDVHNQLRLQKYSLQTSTRFQKYYKSLFLGFLAMAMVNAYLTHKEAARMGGTTAMTRGEWFCMLQNQLLHLRAQDIAGVVATPPITGQKRRRTAQSEDWVVASGTQKRRQRSCKLCAILRADASKKSFATTFYYERCSVDDAKLWLCMKIRREYKGVQKTCFDIWHEYFDAGDAIPRTLGKRVGLRRPGQKAGTRAKTHLELQLHADGGETGSESDDGGSDIE